MGNKHSSEPERHTQVDLSDEGGELAVNEEQEANKLENVRTVHRDRNSPNKEQCLEDKPQSQPVSFNLKLYCVKDQEKSRNVTIVLPRPPMTVLDIKMHVQKELNIPACCQCMAFESRQLRDHYSLEELRIREGDTLVVHYTAEAMVQEVSDVIQAIKDMECFLTREDVQTPLSYGYYSQLDTEISTNLNAHKVESLADTYFHPSNETSQVNRLFFVKNRGLQEMHRLHEELLKYPWRECHLEMQLLEHAILRVLWNISAAFSVRMLLFERPTLEAVFKSLVRMEISADKMIAGPQRMFESTRITCEMLYKAVGTICNLAEIPTCRLKIASRKDVLDQLLATLTCPSYNYIASLVAAAGLLCLAYSPETHQYLITDNVIEKMAKACTANKQQSVMDEQLLKYFRSMFFAQLLHFSESTIPLQRKHKMHSAIKEFLESASYLKIRSHEVKNGYIWSTVTPFVRLVYFPKHNPHWTYSSSELTEEENDEMRELEELCVEAGVFSLQNMLLSEETRQLLIDELLVDYIVCMPWHLSKDSNAYVRACDLNAFLGQKMQLQPPSLVSMAKAKIAMMHCGLDKVLKASSVHEIVDDMINI